MGMMYRNSSYADKQFDYYLYEKDVFGNIIAIYNASGTKVASYCYDAWGNCTVLTNTNGIGTMNPFRYRGYYLDTETNLYYLQSRYYDSYVGRFINADGTINGNGDLIGYNLFAYCSNNPVMYVDPTGEAWWHWAIGAAIVAACAIATIATCGGFAADATAVCMVASGTAAFTTASTVAAAATIGSALVLGTSALDAAVHSTSFEEFADAGNIGTILSTMVGGIMGAGIGFIIGRGINDPSYPTDKARINHIHQEKAGHIPDTSANRAFLSKISAPKNYCGTDMYGNYWYSKTLSDGRQAWSEVRNGIIWDGGINQVPMSWNPFTGLKKR